MKRIVHLADLHFGRADMRKAGILVRTIRGLNPDLVVIAGDLTQRARPGEFRAAREFLDELPSPRLVVPGNHDVPAIYEPWRRFFDPYKLWREYIGGEVEPFFEDSEMAVMGLNTSHPWSIKNGRITSFQVEEAEKKLAELPPRLLKIIVAHHPFDLPPAHRHRLVGGARTFMSATAAHGLDIVLSGHLHNYHVGHSADRYEIEGRSALLIHAGTAISRRLREEANSFNVLAIDDAKLLLGVRSWRAEKGEYAEISADAYLRGQAGWQRV